jgi:predicted nucleic acid-binding protein
LDTSALVKLYVREEGADVVRELVMRCSAAGTSKVAYAEARAAFARALRQGVIGDEGYREIVAALHNDWHTYLAMEVSDALIFLAGDLSERHGLRGFDAIHLASALTLKTQVSEEMVAACFDSRLWEAFRVYLPVMPQTEPV